MYTYLINTHALYQMICVLIISPSIIFAQNLPSNPSSNLSPSEPFGFVLTIPITQLSTQLSQRDPDAEIQTYIFQLQDAFIPRFGYRWHSFLPQLGLSYDRISEDRTIQGTTSSDAWLLSIGVKYFFTPPSLSTQFEGFISGHLLTLLQIKSNERTDYRESPQDQTNFGVEFSIGGQHHLSPHFVVGGSFGFTGYYQSYLQDPDVKTSKVQQNEHYTFSRFFLEIYF